MLLREINISVSMSADGTTFVADDKVNETIQEFYNLDMTYTVTHLVAYLAGQ